MATIHSSHNAVCSLPGHQEYTSLMLRLPLKALIQSGPRRTISLLINSKRNDTNLIMGMISHHTHTPRKGILRGMYCGCRNLGSRFRILPMQQSLSTCCGLRGKGNARRICNQCLLLQTLSRENLSAAMSAHHWCLKWPGSLCDIAVWNWLWLL